ncbi:hypothetical protein HCU40_24035 [Pseudanabaena biceps]|nr:hypothetical protein [Pseudanabaena biceps]NUN67695.1 hypothetical protein [Pseudanabaena biceps]
MSKKLGRSFWGLWLFANVIGGICLPILVWQAPYTIKSQIFLNEVLQSIGIAIAQSYVLRDRFTKEKWWLPLTLFGWLTGLCLVHFVPALAFQINQQNLPLITILVADFAIIGATVGICQWQLLRKFRAGGLWLAASVSALCLSAFGIYLGYMINSSILAIIFQSIIYGAITGLALIKILRSPKLLPKTRK